MVNLTASPHKHWFCWELVITEDGINMGEARERGETERGRSPSSIRRNLCADQWTMVSRDESGQLLSLNQSNQWTVSSPHPSNPPILRDIILLTHRLQVTSVPRSAPRSHVMVGCPLWESGVCVCVCVCVCAWAASVKAGVFVLPTNRTHPGLFLYSLIRGTSWVFSDILRLPAWLLCFCII